MSEESAREPTLRAIAMPADANPNGDIFGGWLLSQMDLAGGSRGRPAGARAGGDGGGHRHDLSTCRSSSATR